ncbi:hypothetical protein DFH07DRAFT_951799 [Mycena maculata]|uniref:Uncharacterized protein n=1 Tax=Mycena maculata TaxID=230809 RepID=A0AAD7NUZ2_9AGAR|nr:hypothetical protein DFH07DRAFT_951799 [Mycena maculata]
MSSDEREPTPHEPRRVEIAVTLGDFIAAAARKRRKVAEDVVKTPFADLDAQALREYIALTNTGIYRGREAEKVLRLEVVGDRYGDVTSTDGAALQRDVDSILVFARAFPWAAGCSLITAPKDPETLGNSHCQVEFRTSDGERFFRDPGDDPCIWLFDCGPDGYFSIYLMVPAYDRILHCELDVQLYAIIMKVMQRVYWESTLTMCPDLASERRRQEKFTGKPAYGTSSRKQISLFYVDEFTTLLTKEIHKTDWGRTSYWFLQIRNQKDRTRNPPGSRRELQESIQDLLSDAVVEHATVFVDIGVEIQPPKGYAVLPLRERLSDLRMALLGLSEEECELGDAYHDPWAGVAAIGGGRWNTKKNRLTANKISYTQVYTTDKSALYHASKGHRMPRLAEMMALRLKDANQEIDMLREVYANLRSCLSKKKEIATRIEARVPLDRASYMFEDARLVDCKNTCVLLPVEEAWGWRVERMMGFVVALRMSAAQDIEDRAQPDALKCVAAIVYALNALFSAPADKQKDRTLCLAVFPTFRANRAFERYCQGFWFPRSAGSETPYMDRGAMWLPDFSFATVGVTSMLRFLNSPVLLNRDQIASICGVPWPNIEALFLLHRTIPERPYRRNVKGAKAIQARPEIAGSFSLQRIHTPYDHGPDLDPEARFGEIPDGTPDSASEIFLGIIGEVFQLIGHSADRLDTYCVLTPQQKLLVGPATFKDPQLLTYFPRGYVNNTKVVWDKTAKLLFPPPAEGHKYTSNRWTKLPSVGKYLRYCTGPREEADRLRAFCIAEFQKLRWFPSVVADKVHDYREMPQSTGWVAFGSFRRGKQGVKVAWNATHREGYNVMTKGALKLDAAAVQQWRKDRQEARAANEGMAADEAAAEQVRREAEAQEEEEEEEEAQILQVQKPTMPPETLARLAGSKTHWQGRIHLPPGTPDNLRKRRREEEEEESEDGERGSQRQRREEEEED